MTRPSVRVTGVARQVEKKEVAVRTTARTGLGARRCGVAVVLVAVVLLGGCTPGEVMDAVTGGGPVVLVTAAEKEALGYENPGGERNSKLQRVAIEHRREIYAEVKPFVERELGREVELGPFSASYPYAAIDVAYRTVDEPVVAGNAYVGLGSDGSVRSIEPIDADWIGDRTVEGLHLMAYRDRIDRMREYLAATYPDFTSLPSGYMAFTRRVDPIFEFGVYRQFHELTPAAVINAQTAAVYAEYREDPDRTDAEWREVFETELGDREIAISVDLMLADPQQELIREQSIRVADDLRSNPLFAGYGEWRVNLHSNLMLRDTNPVRIFHRSFLFHGLLDRPDWLVGCWLDGGTLSDQECRGGLDPKPSGASSSEGES